MRESPDQAFSISPPGQEAYAGSCEIAGRASKDSLWAQNGGILWRLLDAGVDKASAPLFPIHDACIAMVQIVAASHASTKLPSNRNFTLLEDYHDASIRLFERLTEWPWEQPKLIDQLEEVGGDSCGYGPLDWNGSMVATDGILGYHRTGLKEIRR